MYNITDSESFKEWRTEREEEWQREVQKYNFHNDLSVYGLRKVEDYDGGGWPAWVSSGNPDIPSFVSEFIIEWTDASGELHREDAPAMYMFIEYLNKWVYEFNIHGKPHDEETFWNRGAFSYTDECIDEF